MGNCRLHESLIGIRGGGFIFGIADNNAGIGLVDHMCQNVGILIFWRFRAIAFRLGIGGGMKGVILDRLMDVTCDGKHLAFSLLSDANTDSGIVLVSCADLQQTCLIAGFESLAHSLTSAGKILI
jgi:hypothetical protein